MDNFEKCVHVQDVSKVAYWRYHDGLGLYELEEGIVAVMPGNYAVWIATADGPGLAEMSEEEFNSLFVKEEDLPDKFRGHLDAAPSYDDWCRSTDTTKADK